MRQPTRWSGLALAGLLVGLLLAACTSGTAGLEVGDPAPDFELPGLDGQPIRLSQFRGRRPVLLYFHMAVG